MMSEKYADEVIRVCRLTNSAFSNYITGQTLEAIILALLFVPFMAIFKMPYIPLICVVIAVTALVPLVGAFAGCILGAFFILVNDPMQAVVFVIMFLVIQQIEGNLIYPRVVGESIGLPGMWVLLAVAVGGGLFGVGGMFLMVPLAAVLYTLLREHTHARLDQRDIDPDKLRSHPPELQSHFKMKRQKRQAKRQERRDERKSKKVQVRVVDEEELEDEE
jgi:predicted PurR-regulated permease PerM